MLRVKYIGNKDLANSNVIIHISPTKSVGVGGEVEVTKEELEYWSQWFNFEKVEVTRLKVVESVNRTVTRAADRA